jgi:hypothetical protein
VHLVWLRSHHHLQGAFLVHLLEARVDRGIHQGR